MNKKLLAVLAAIAVVFLLVIIVIKYKPRPEPTHPSITIAQAGDFYLYAPLYIAADKGFFTNNGLSVTIVSTGGDEKTWAAVMAGSAQFGVADPTFIAIANQRGQPGKIVATIVNGVPFWGITKKTSVPIITKPADLNGFTVATFPSPSSAYTLQKKMFESGGLTPKIREGAFGTLMALMEAGQADIALELEPNVSQATANGYKIVYSLSDIYGDFTITGLTTTPDYIQRNPQIVGAVVKSIGEAMEFLQQNPDQSAEILAKRFPEIKKDVAVAALRRVLSAGIIPKNPIVMEGAWRKALQLRIDAGDVRPTSSVMELVDNSFTK